MKTKLSLLILLLFSFSITFYGYEKNTDLYSFSISKSEVTDSLVFNGKKVKVDMVSESAITPNKIVFKNSNLKEILKAVFVVPEKYIKIKNDQLYDFTLILKQKNVKTDTIRRIFISNIFEALHLQIKLNVEKKDVYDLVVVDSAKYKMLSSKHSAKKSNISKIAYQLDNKYKGIFISGSDTSSISPIDLREEITFQKLIEKFKMEYGLGFVKSNKEIQFVEIE